MFRKYWLIGCFLFLALGAQAQLSITGTVRDQKTGESLPGVSIVIKGSNQGSLSDDKGHFKIEVPTEKTTLQFSFIGYEQQFYKTGKTSAISIKLSPQTKLFKAIDVNQYNIEAIAKSADWDVIDYLFTEDKLIVSAYLNTISGYQLLLMDVDGRPLDTLKAPGKPLGLFKSCADKPYLITGFSCHELLTDTNTLSIGQTTHIQQFQSIVLPCIAADEDNNYFEERKETERFLKIGAAKYAIRYFFINKRDPKKIQQNLQILRGMVAIKPNKPEKQFLKERKKAGIYLFSELEEEDAFFTERILFKELYDPLIKINDQIAIFDHENGNITTYLHNDTIDKSVPINYQSLKGWKKALVLNEERSKVYALFDRKEAAELREINMSDGTIAAEQRIPVLFPEKIKVKSGYAYFIGKGVKAGDRLFLARMAIR